MIYLQHLVGYKLADCIDDLTCDQEILVALVANEQLRMQIQMAGGEVPPGKSKRRRSKSRDLDPYGKLLEQQARMKDLHQKFARDKSLLEKYSKPL